MSIKHVIFAGLLTLAAPIAAYAHTSGCGFEDQNCVTGTNLIGTSVSTYELATRINAKDSTTDYLTPSVSERSSGKIVKIYRTNVDILNVPKGMPQIGAPQG